MGIPDRPLTIDDWLSENVSDFKFFQIDHAAYQHNITLVKYIRVYSSLVAGLFAGSIPLGPKYALIVYVLVNVIFTFMIKYFSEKKLKLECCFLNKYNIYTISPFFGFMTFIFAWFVSYNFAFYDFK